MKAKIYIETSHSNFTHQVANYIHTIEKEECKTIFVLNGTRLNNKALKLHGISSIHYKAGELQNTLINIARVLNNHNVTEIEIHVEANTASFILLAFLSVFKDSLHLIKPHIYESSIRDYSLRLASYNNRSLQLKLKEALQGGGFIGNNKELMTSGYIWHNFTDTTYYVIKKDTNKSDFPATLIPPLLNRQKQSFAELFGIPESIIMALINSFEKEDVFYCSNIMPRHSIFYKTHQEGLKEQLLNIQHREKRNKFIIFSHHENNADLLKLICDQFYQLPSCISSSVMIWLDINPKNVITTLNDDIAIINDERKCFIISVLEKNEILAEQSAFLRISNLPIDNIYFTHELQRYHSEGNVKRIFYSSASMGDVIYGIGAINALRDNYPKDDFVFVTHKLYADLINNCPSNIEHWDINKLTSTQQFEIEIANQFAQLHFFERWEQIISSFHMTDAFINEVTRNNIYKNKNALLNLDKIDKSPIEMFMSKNKITSGKVALLHPNIGSPNRTWTKYYWEKLAERFVSHGWQVILIGSDNNKYQNKKTMTLDTPGIFNAMNKFSVIQTVYLMSLCQILVACDSGPVALAGYTDIAISALYSIIPSQYRLPYRHDVLGWNAQGINVGCQYGQCGHLIMNDSFFKKTLHKKWSRPTGRQFAEWCPNNKKYICLKRFSDADWWSKIKEFIASDDFVVNNKKSL